MDLVACYMDGVDSEEEVIRVNESFAVPIVDRDGQVLEKPLVGEAAKIMFGKMANPFRPKGMGKRPACGQ